MWSFLYSTAVGNLALLQCVSAGLSSGPFEANTMGYARRLESTMQQELASLLSSNATIITPTDAGCVNETERYMLNVQPHVQFSVQVATEDDVPIVVQFANSHNISFYAVSRGHALTTSVARFSGIEIDLRNLDGIQINSDNKTVHLQGGVYSYNVIHDLWDQGFVTATGSCTCVSVVGPALGGGHGLQQGKHGLTMDHFVSLNVVLANGTALTVNETSNPDLWWAMRGAGHNFGIVTSWDAKLWEDNFRTYFVRTYQFTGTSLEPLIEEVNRFQGNGSLDPVWLGAMGLITTNTTVSETEATISWTFLYDGTQADAEPWLAPFDALGPVSVQDNTTTYYDIDDFMAGSINGSLCTPNKTHIIGTANLQVYNVTAMRAIYDLYGEKIRQHPELNQTRVLHEGYSMAGVESFPANGSAFPQRDEYILTYFDTRFDTTDDPLIEFATEWRNQTVALWNAGQPERKPTAYVNYAAGYESLEYRYGHEPWRLEKLRSLKEEYDPRNSFAWYNPINPFPGEE